MNKEGYIVLSVGITLLSIVALFIALVFGKDSIASDCRTMGKFHFDGITYECKPIKKIK